MQREQESKITPARWRASHARRRGRTPYARPPGARFAGLGITLAVTLILSSLVVPTPQRASAATPTTKLGYFWTPPSDGTSTSKLATTADMVMFGEGRESYRNQLESAGFNGSAMQYMLAMEVEGPGPYASSASSCNTGHVPLHNQVADEKGDFCRYVHPNESWFLHNSSGRRLYFNDDGRIMYYMNPGSSGWRDFARSRILQDANNLGWDGIFLDNVDLSLWRATEYATNANGAVKEYNNNDVYRNAWVGYLGVISNALPSGKKLWGNMTSDQFTGNSWNSYLQHLDGGMFEGFATGYASSGVSVSRWEAMVEQYENAINMGKGVLGVAQGDRYDNTRQTFGLASYLLVTDTQNGYFRYARAGSYGSWWLYSNYDIALGNPSGNRYKLSDGRWKRDFACGNVVVDPARRTASINQSSCSSTDPDPTPQPPPGGGSDGGGTGIGTIQAEDYRAGGEGNAYHDTSGGNSGGAYRNDDVDIQRCDDPNTPTDCYNVGWIDAGEWLTYDVTLPDSGEYDVVIRVAAPDAGARLRVEIDGQQLKDDVSIPNTGGWQNWTNVRIDSVWLPDGNHRVRIVAETDRFNMNYFTISHD